MEVFDVDLIPLKQELSRLIELYNRSCQLKNDGDLHGALQVQGQLCRMMVVMKRYLHEHRLLDNHIHLEPNITIGEIYGGPLHIGSVESTSGRSV